MMEHWWQLPINSSNGYGKQPHFSKKKFHIHNSQALFVNEPFGEISFQQKAGVKPSRVRCHSFDTS
jgi:hypothetical protein